MYFVSIVRFIVLLYFVGVYLFRWILAVFHRADFYTSIVMLHQRAHPGCQADIMLFNMHESHKSDANKGKRIFGKTRLLFVTQEITGRSNTISKCEVIEPWFCTGCISFLWFLLHLEWNVCWFYWINAKRVTFMLNNLSIFFSLATIFGSYNVNTLQGIIYWTYWWIANLRWVEFLVTFLTTLHFCDFYWCLATADPLMCFIICIHAFLGFADIVKPGLSGQNGTDPFTHLFSQVVMGLKLIT